jgi:predicted MFS family arabinose efflux permease
MGVGSLAGSLTLAVMRQRRAIPLMLFGGLVFATLLVGIAASRHVLLAGAFVMAAGYASMLMINTINATVQANVTDALRGRVMSFYVTVFAGSAPLGGLFAGAVAESWGTPAAFLAGSALSFLTVGVVALGLRSARRRGTLGVTTLEGGSEARPGGAPARAPGGASAAR